MPEKTVQWFDVLTDLAVSYEYVQILDAGNSTWHDLEYIADYTINRGVWDSLGDNLTYTLANCEPRLVDRHSTVTVFYTNDINDFPGDELLEESETPMPPLSYFNDKTIHFLSAREKFNRCDTNLTSLEISALDKVIKTASDADILDFIVACLSVDQAVSHDS